MKTYVYVDGFNLYYRILKDNPKYKWINIHALAQNVLSSANIIEKSRYFIARVSGRIDPQAPARQNQLLTAMGSVPEIEIHYGNFLVKKVWSGLVFPDLDQNKRNVKPPFLPWPNVARVYKTEEKGSDVNLAVHLLNDAFNNRFDVAAVITNDTDLTEALKIVRDMGKTVGLITPVPQPATSLMRVASFCHHIRESHLAASQFPNSITMPNGRVATKPASWI